MRGGYEYRNQANEREAGLLVGVGGHDFSSIGHLGGSVQTLEGFDGMAEKRKIFRELVRKQIDLNPTNLPQWTRCLSGEYCRKILIVRHSGNVDHIY